MEQKIEDKKELDEDLLLMGIPKSTLLKPQNDVFAFVVN